MTICYILVVLSALGYAVNFALTKIYQLKEGNTIETGVRQGDGSLDTRKLNKTTEPSPCLFGSAAI